MFFFSSGRYASDVVDINFEKKMEELSKLMTTQQTVYETEEKTLKVGIWIYLSPLVWKFHPQRNPWKKENWGESLGDEQRFGLLAAGRYLAKMASWHRGLALLGLN